MPLHSGDVQEAAGWLRLGLCPGLGPIGARSLLERLGAPDAILAAPRARLAALVGEAVATALQAPDEACERQLARTLEWLQDDAHHLVTLADPDYPARLLQVADAPPLLHVVGRRDALARPMVAIVGSRNPTASGLADARDFACALSQAGWTVVSGLALGIDGAAHAGALAGAAGTVAVLGTGADVVYPGRHRGLAARIATDGAVVAELPLGTEPRPGLFPRRNRLIAGMSDGVLVIEAALHSGSLITARQAGEFGREVFAVPGSIHSPLARGCHALIRQGAALVESAADVLAELRGPAQRRLLPEPVPQATAAAAPGAARRPDAHDDDPLLAAIGRAPVLPDRLALELGLPAGELGARLVLLELEGRLLRLTDGRVVRA